MKQLALAHVPPVADFPISGSAPVLHRRLWIVGPVGLFIILCVSTTSTSRVLAEKPGPGMGSESLDLFHLFPSEVPRNLACIGATDFRLPA